MSPHLASLVEAWRDMRRAARDTCGHNDFRALAAALERRPLLVIAASGNSAYAARYIEWLVSRTAAPARLVTPLEYALAPPREPHCCLLVSQGARRRDSVAMVSLARRRDVPFFVLCGDAALEGETVAARLVAEGARDHVFVTAPLGEHAFLNLTGTAAAFAAGRDMAAALAPGAVAPFDLDWDAIDAAVADMGEPAGERAMTLHGPAGRCAAEAFAGYHCESLGPVVACDMKNFTHGVWRGLTEAGRATVYVVADRQVGRLAGAVVEALREEHDARLVEAPPGAAELEPVALFVLMTAHWVEHCKRRARHDPGWSPLTIDRARWANFLPLTTFDLTTLP